LRAARVLRQQEERPGERVGRRLVRREEQDVALPDEFALGERLAFVARAHEVGQHVVAVQSLSALVLDHRAHECLERVRLAEHAPVGRSGQVPRECAAVEAEVVVPPALDRVSDGGRLVQVRKTEQCRRSEMPGELLHVGGEVASFTRLPGFEHAADHAQHRVEVARHCALLERGADHAAVAPVFLAVHPEHAVAQAAMGAAAGAGERERRVAKACVGEHFAHDLRVDSDDERARERAPVARKRQDDGGPRAFDQFAEAADRVALERDGEAREVENAAAAQRLSCRIAAPG